MKQHPPSLSVTQFMILLWGSLFSPVMELLLSVVSETTPRVGFLTPLLALPFLLLSGYVLLSLCSTTEGHVQGLTHGFSWGTSRPVYLFILLSYLCWAVLLLSVRLQLSALSFRSVGYKEGSFFFLLPVLALFVWWMAGTGLTSFARGSTFFFAALVVLFLLIMGLSFSDVQLIYLLPVTTSDLLPLAQGLSGVLGILGYLIFSAFFLGEVAWGDSASNHRTWISCCVLASVGMSVFLFVATGTFGSALLQNMGDPFLQLAKGVGVEGGFQRIESLVAAVWTLADFLLLGVLLRSSACLVEKILTLTKKNQKEFPHLDSVILGVIVLISSGIALFFPYIHSISDSVILFGNLIFGFGIPFGLFLIKKVLHSREKRGRLEAV